MAVTVQMAAVPNQTQTPGLITLPTGTTWELTPDGHLIVHDSNGKAIAIYAPGGWAACGVIS